jgi:hypothetical protein
MKKIMAIASIAIGMIACDTSQLASPSQTLTSRAVLEKLPEGTQVLVSIPGDLTLIGKTFVVKGDGNGSAATCVSGALPGVVLHLTTLTQAGTNPDAAATRGNSTYAFSTEMPQGTQLMLVGWARAYCVGNPIFVAEVVNGS